MQQWGSWICYEDQNTGGLFWYDQKNKVNSWVKPKEVEELQAKAMTDATSRWNHLQKCGSMRLKKIGDWIQYTGGMGKVFYFNEKTYEFQWERPEELGDDEGTKCVQKEEDLSVSKTAARPSAAETKRKEKANARAHAQASVIPQVQEQVKKFAILFTKISI